MRGKALTPKTSTFSHIFWHIRTARAGSSLRRSWQRRARLALAALNWLTPAERHEIMCVWSRGDAHQIDSPALRKLLAGTGSRVPLQAHEWQKPARGYLRAGFRPDGQPTRRRVASPAANDVSIDTRTLNTPQRLAGLHTHEQDAVPAAALSHGHTVVPALPVTYQRAQGGNANRFSSSCDTRSRLRRRTWPTLARPKSTPQIELPFS